MCEQTSVNYNDGDVVWVKLSPCWWPGEIVSFDTLPSDIAASFKKPPLAVVKFFDEEKYEFIRQLTHISPYNSDKKYEFIKKGMDLYRAKHRYMGKFQEDVVAAEKKTNGDPNILNDPRLAPEKKTNWASMFGSPKFKKKDSPSRVRGRGGGKKSHASPASLKKTATVITHPRFLGQDDSEIRILVQTPLETTKLPDQEYSCYICNFKTNRIDVIVFHNKSHSNFSTSPKKTKKSPPRKGKRRRFPASKTTTIEEDLELLRQGVPICSNDEDSSSNSSGMSSQGDETVSVTSSDEEPPVVVKRKTKSASPVKSKKAKTTPSPVPPPSAPEVKKQTDIRTDLLAEWDDDEDEDELAALSTRLSPKPEEGTNDSAKDGEKKEKSCFDFVEDEEDLVATVEGRKIPRVIPPASERRKSAQEENVIEAETEKPKENKGEKNDSSFEKKRESQFQKEFEAFNNALQETTVPEILDVPPLLKSEQNFHNAKTIKFPDKKRGKSKTTGRYSRNDEPKPTKSAQINKKDTPPVVDTPPIVDTPPVMDTPPVEATPPVEVTPPVIDTPPVTDTPPVIDTPLVIESPQPEPIKEPVVKNTEIATKLTNPKKRFVKTFEDETKNSTKVEEKMGNSSKEEGKIENSSKEEEKIENSSKEEEKIENSSKEEEKIENSSKEEEKIENSSKEEEKIENSSKEEEKIESSSKEEAKEDRKEDVIPESAPKEETKSLEVAKLKTQLMKKLGDAPKRENLRRWGASSKKENVTIEPVKPPRQRRRSKVEIVKTELAISKENKRTISESASGSDSETKVHPKKQKLAPIEANKKEKAAKIAERVSPALPEKPAEIELPKAENSKNLGKYEEKKPFAHLDYLKTSPTKLFSDLKVDKDNGIEGNVLSESQRLTIQSIIGVTSPVGTSQFFSDKTETEKKIKIATSIEETAKIDPIEKEENKGETGKIDDQDEIARNEIKTISETTEEFMKDATEEKIKDLNNQIFNISKKLDEAIPESLPDEIIETPEDESKQNSDDSNDRMSGDKSVEKTLETKLSEKRFDEAIEELLKRPDKAKKVIVEEINQEIKQLKASSPPIEEKEDVLKSEEITTKEEILKAEIVEQKAGETEKVEKPDEMEKLEKPDETGREVEKPEETEEIEKTNEKEKVERIDETEKIEKSNEKPTPDTETPKEVSETVTENVTVEKPKEIVVPEVEIEKDSCLPVEAKSTTTDLVKSMFEGEEMVNIEGNLTVVTESDLADKQVEITATPEATKPVTLSSFSMDFCEDAETYIKADTVIPDLKKSKSPRSTYHQEDKISPEGEQTKVSEPDSKETPTIEDKKSNEEKIFDIQTDVNSTKLLEPSKMKKFEDIIPAKEVPPPVIMEGFEEMREDGAEDRLTIDESIVKPTVEEKEKSVKQTVKESENTTDQQPQEKEEIIVPPMDISVESEVAKITDCISEQEVVVQDKQHSTTSTKLLEILTDKPKTTTTKVAPSTPAHTEEIVVKTGKPLIAKQSTPGPSRTPKATILSDKLIKPLDESKTVSVKKVTSKRSYQDVEDIDTYIIQKPLKKLNVSTESDAPAAPKVIKKTPATSKGKARILQQTIITPTGDILQPPVSQHQTDDNMFDINSMPIVLSDELLTAEGIENMQIVLPETPPKTQINPIKKTQMITPQQQVKLLNKTQSPQINIKSSATKASTAPSSVGILNRQKMQKVLPPATSSTKILKHSPSVITQPGKPGKFIIVPATTTATGTKYTVGKRPAIVKKPPQKVLTPISKVPEPTPMTSAGNKIMILKGQGQQQQKILVTTPQKQITPSKMKGRPLGQKQIIKELPQQKGANIISQTIVNSKGQVTTLATQSPMGVGRQQILAAQQNRNIKIDPGKMRKVSQQRLPNELSKPGPSGQQRTIIIKNPQGQTVKKFQGTDDALLDQQVAEQLQAINRASASQHLKDLSPRTPAKLQPKKIYGKKQEPTRQTKTILQNTQKDAVPPLAPISPTKKGSESRHVETSESAEGKADEPKRPPHQLVIQDAQGNQTTITEGQILALPSEAIDGQPHSYVLVTLDETGNLTPLNSEALMSLDPNLNLTSDLGNMVLQIDQGSAAQEAEAPTQVETPQQQPQPRPPIPETTPANTDKLLAKEPAEKIAETPPVTEAAEQNVQAVINSGEMGQLIITGDAATAQKFLESLAEGNADLANLLANAEGNVLIQADGQQILINTDAENPMLVMNPEGIAGENSEGSGNPIFASQPVKNQDILAAALADTDVFQQDQSITHSPSKVAQSQLSPNSALYPIGVTNVLETNSMSSPIMTPLEVPSTNSKKIDDENEILNQVPKNVDLPITITDPNISQTVAQQQVASLIASELQSNLDLPLAIQDPGLSVTSAEMSSPSFVYSLPTLDDTVDINQKAFSGSISMPLLTEEPEDTMNVGTSNNAVTEKNDSKDKLDGEDKDAQEKPKTPTIDEKKPPEDDDKDDSDDKKTDFLNSEGLCSIRGGICNSLSEPPPDMFDFSVENQTYDPSNLSHAGDMDIALDSTPSSDGNALNDREGSVSSMDDRKNEDSALYTVNTTSPSTNTDDSCEIPVQPPIIAKSFPEENGTSNSCVNNDKITTDREDV